MAAPEQDVDDITSKREALEESPLPPARGPIITILGLGPPPAIERQEPQRVPQTHQPSQQHFVAVVDSQLDGPPPYVAEHVPGESREPVPVQGIPVNGVPAIRPPPFDQLVHFHQQMPGVNGAPMEAPPGVAPERLDHLEVVLALSRSVKWVSVLDMLCLLMYGFIDFLFLFLLPLPIIGYLGAQRLHRTFTAAYVIVLISLIALRALLIMLSEHIWIQVMYACVVLLEIWILRIVYSFWRHIGDLTDEEKLVLMTPQYTPQLAVVVW